MRRRNWLALATLLLAWPARAAEPLVATAPDPAAPGTKLVLGLTTVRDDAAPGRQDLREPGADTVGSRHGPSERIGLELRLDLARRAPSTAPEVQGASGEVAAGAPALAAPAEPTPPPPAEALSASAPGPAATVLDRPDELRDFIPGDDPLHRRAASAAERKGGAVAFGIVAAGAAALVVPLLMFDFMDFTVDGQGPRVPRFLIALGVSVGSGGLFLGFNASANREARQVAEAWNAAHPERPVQWAP